MKTSYRPAFCTLITSLALLSFVSMASAQGSYTSYGAQQISNFRNDAVGTTNTVAGISQIATAVGSQFRQSSTAATSSIGGNAATFAPTARAQKPFANLSPSPTVSPYLTMHNAGIFADDVDTYNTLVRPQLRQQQFNNQVQRQAQQLNARFQSLAAQPAFNPQGSERMMGTGHRTMFNNTLQYYPLRNRR